MATEHTQLNRMQLLFDALYSNKGLGGILDISEDLLGNPLALNDLTYKFMSSSKKFIETIPIGHRITSGYLDPDTVKNIQNDSLYEEVFRVKTPYITSQTDIHGIRWIMAPVLIHHSIAAILVVPDTIRSFRNEDLEFVHLICQVLSLELQKDVFYHDNIGTKEEVFLMDLVNNHVKTSILLNKHMSLLGIRQQPYNFICIVKWREDELTAKELKIISNEIRSLLTPTLTVVHDAAIVMLLSADTNIPYEANVSGKLREFSSKHEADIGISFCYSDLTESHKYYEQAKQAILHGTSVFSDPGVFHYKDLSIYPFIKKCAPNENLWDYCHPGLIELYHYDQTKNNELMKTLFYYLKAPRDWYRAASQLNVHKNTLVYRIKRIEEKFHLDLSDGEIIFQLIFSYKLLHAMGIKY